MTSAAPQRKRLTAHERRESILSAALAIFGDRGYYAASVDEIAERTGISKPVVYDHFPSKQALYSAALLRQADLLLEEIVLHLDPGTESLEQRTRSIAAAHCRFARRSPAAARLLFVESVAEPEVARTYLELRRRAVAVAADVTASDPSFGARRGVSRRRAAEIFGYIQFSAFAAIAIWSLEHPAVPVAQVVSVFMDCMWIGLKRSSAGELWLPVDARE